MRRLTSALARGWRAALGVPTLALAFSSLACGPSGTPASQASRASEDAGGAQSRVVLAAPGRIEGATEVVEVGAAMDGVLAEVLVEEGKQVARGDILARIACDDVEARLSAARAEAESANQARTRVARGRRDEERRAAAATTAAAKAVLDRARLSYERTMRLAKEGAIVSQDEVDLARRDLDVAEAAHRAMVEEEALANAGPLPEEIARATSDAAAAERRAAEAAARVDKCAIRAPMAGSVLRRHLQAGEQVSLALPRPVISLADTSHLRARAEVDERDVARVRVGQAALITADALGAERLQGRVTRIEPMMGRKRVRTGDPAEKSDRDVLEVIVDLDDGGPRLTVGLRVTVMFISER